MLVRVRCSRPASEPLMRLALQIAEFIAVSVSALSFIAATYHDGWRGFLRGL